MTPTEIFMYTAAVLSVYFIYYKVKRHYQYWKSLGIPCESPHYIYGTLRGLAKTRGFHQIALDYYNKFRGSGPFAGFYWFFQRSVIVLDVTLAKNILIKDFSNFTDRGFYSNPRDDPLTGHLFFMDGQLWKNLRNKLSPTFTSGKMKFMFPTILKVSDQFMQVLEDEISKNTEIEMKDLLARFTTDIIGTCAFGIDCNSLKNPKAEFRVMGKESVEVNSLFIMLFSSFPSLAYKLRLKLTPKYIESFFLRIVRETISLRESTGVRRNDFMDLLIEMKNSKKFDTGQDDMRNLTVEEIAAQAFVFFGAGFETSSTTMSFALYSLALHAEVQDKARKEIQDIITNNGGEFTYESLKQMKYLNQIVSETLRLYTVLPVLNRLCLKDYVVPNYPNYVIKKGMKVIIPAGAIHRDEKHFPNPDVFNPDNFAPEKVEARDSVLWLAFGDGPRNCIGMRFGLMQTMVGLAYLLKNFKFSICGKTPIPIEYNKESFLLNSISGIYLKVEPVV